MQCMAQPLVLDDRAGVDLAEPVVALIAKALAVGSDLDVSVGVLVDVDVAVDEREVGLAVLEQVADLVVLRAVRCLFAMRAALSADANRFVQRFGVQPELRAALHLGEVIAARSAKCAARSSSMATS